MKENKVIYPVEAWDITEEKFRMEHVYRNETTFALSNGYIGTRGTFEEGYPFSEDEGLEGNFINGFYESEEIRYGEWNYGFPTKSQTLLNLPNGKPTDAPYERRGVRKGNGMGKPVGETSTYPHKASCFFCLQKSDGNGIRGDTVKLYGKNPSGIGFGRGGGKPYEENESAGGLRPVREAFAAGKDRGRRRNPLL